MYRMGGSSYDATQCHLSVNVTVFEDTYCDSRLVAELEEKRGFSAAHAPAAAAPDNMNAV